MKQKKSLNNDNNEVLQKPFRCTKELDVRLNRAKGALMLQTGERISDNQFITDLLNLGLKSLQEKLGGQVS